MKGLRKGVLLGMVFLSLLLACSGSSKNITDVKIYLGTPAWELAKAVDNQNVRKIAKIAEKNPELLDYQDPFHGTTLLFWAVGMEKYEAAEELLKAGANPDIISLYDGGTALYRAAGFSLIDNDAKNDPKFVKLLLQYGANPNIGYVGNERNNNLEIGTTPLMRSIGCGIEKTKILVEGGAEINFKTTYGETAAICALLLGSGGKDDTAKEYAHYLIVEKKANVRDSYRVFIGIASTNIDRYPVDLLRYWVSDIDSYGHRMKMEIVEEFTRQGVDYWATEIPQYYLEQIQKRYPDTWEEYIKKY